MTALKAIAVGGLTVFGVSALTVPAERLDTAQRPLNIPESLDQDFVPISTPKQLVDSESLQASITSDKLLARAKQLYEIAGLSREEYNHPTRVIGSKGHLGTLDYIVDSLNKLDGYYNVSRQPFGAVSGNVFYSELVLGHHRAETAQPMGLTPPTEGRSPVRGDLVLVANDGCKPEDYPSETAGNIAFIKRGSCPFGTKSALAGKAGAIAAIVYNYNPDSIIGTLGTPSPDHVATFSLSGIEGKPIVEHLKSGERISATAHIDAVVKTIETYNIIAQTQHGDPENCVMLGAHSDSVAEGPGINDDGSGSMSLLEVATQLAAFRVNNCVRFAWWSAEEEGLLGSDYYVETLTASERHKIRLFMDYDMLASPNFAYQVYDARDSEEGIPVGSQALRDLYVRWYEANGFNYTFIPFDGRSDYDAFIRGGIPAGGIATGAEGIKTHEEAIAFGGEPGIAYDPCYHQLCDAVSNVNLTAWEVNTKVSRALLTLKCVGFGG